LEIESHYFVNKMAGTKSLFWLVLIVCAFAFTGCVEIDCAIDMDEEGKQHIAVTSVMDLKYKGVAQLYKANIAASGYQVYDSIAGGKYYILAHRDTSGSVLLFPYLSGMVDSVRFKPDSRDVRVVRIVTFDAAYTFNKDASMLRDTTGAQIPLVKYRIRMPGLFAETNSLRKDDHGYYVWEYPIVPNSKVDIAYKVFQPDWLSIGLGSVSIALLLYSVITALVKKKRND
jgi:hypothetical protein